MTKHIAHFVNPNFIPYCLNTMRIYCEICNDSYNPKTEIFVSKCVYEKKIDDIDMYITLTRFPLDTEKRELHEKIIKGKRPRIDVVSRIPQIRFGLLQKSRISDHVLYVEAV